MSRISFVLAGVSLPGGGDDIGWRLWPMVSPYPGIEERPVYRAPPVRNPPRPGWDELDYVESIEVSFHAKPDVDNFISSMQLNGMNMLGEPQRADILRALRKLIADLEVHNEEE